MELVLLAECDHGFRNLEELLPMLTGRSYHYAYQFRRQKRSLFRHAQTSNTSRAIGGKLWGNNDAGDLRDHAGDRGLFSSGSKIGNGSWIVKSIARVGGYRVGISKILGETTSCQICLFCIYTSVRT